MEKFCTKLHVRRYRDRYWFSGTSFAAEFWYVCHRHKGMQASTKSGQRNSELVSASARVTQYLPMVHFRLPWRYPRAIDRHQTARRSVGVRPSSMCNISAKPVKQFHRSCIANGQTDRQTDRQTNRKPNIPHYRNRRRDNKRSK